MIARLLDQPLELAYDAVDPERPLAPRYRWWKRHRSRRGRAAGRRVYGYRIRPTPYPSGGQYQTAGLIEKVFAEGPKQYRFVRAETHPSSADAAAFAIAKGKQIINEQGDRFFELSR